MPVVYRVEHRTRYIYGSRVSTSQHIACLKPRELPIQQVRSFDLAIDPAPGRLTQRTDYFGNTLHHFQLLGPHDELTVTATSIVAVHPRGDRPPAGDTIPWERARDWLAQPPADAGRDVIQYTGRSPHVTGTAEICAFARESFPAGQPILDSALHLMHRIHHEFVFDPDATSLATPSATVLAERRGVCQDFAHFQIACLRSLGLAARYVSGYLLTDPPPEQPRLVGADASHAWLSVYVPGDDWVDLDPTNDLVVDQRHVTTGWGRDYGDVTPLRGVLLGGASHRLIVGVSVLPVEDTA